MMPPAKTFLRLLSISAGSLLLLCAAPAAAQSNAAGRYGIWRADDKDTGCMLTLDSRARGPRGFKAQLAPACRDNGMVIFDPVSWRLERGHLVLTARKGHEAHFEAQGSGWSRDAKEGKALILKPL